MAKKPILEQILYECLNNSFDIYLIGHPYTLSSYTIFMFAGMLIGDIVYLK